ncbi:hypothetical protein BBJ28_00013443 [Nothophytophthora sp. Chile5]|nr:hypothetical protein BBJ28_00013443 [Nothophytophthora sp. Chile5]
MSSKKTSLSVDASLATCLDFASRVLSSSASAQEMCTKATLAPIVVDAHRYGQQMMRQLDTAPIRDLRKLFRLLRGNQEQQQGGNASDSPLESLAIADVTWDFEGIVTHTLEMELLELEERAATSKTSICVVFTTSTLALKGEQAIIWFPKENFQSECDLDGLRGTKKRHYLLYVCPGRIKVVKSVAELIKKMYEQLPSIRGSDAKYNVWTVIRKSQPSNQRDQQSRFSPIEPRRSMGDNDQVEASMTRKTEDAVPICPERSPTPEQQEQGTQSSRCFRLVPARSDEGTSSAKQKALSMFTFEATSTICKSPEATSCEQLQQESEPQEQEQEQEQEEDREDDESAAEADKEDASETVLSSSKAAESPAASRDRPARACSGRSVLSASLGAFQKGRDDTNSEIQHGESAGLKPCLTWQSCDGKLKRGFVKSPRTETDRPVVECDGKTVVDLQRTDEPEECDQMGESREGLQYWMVGGSAASDECSLAPSIFAFGSAPQSNQEESYTSREMIDSPMDPILPGESTELHHRDGSSWIEPIASSSGDWGVPPPHPEAVQSPVLSISSAEMEKVELVQQTEFIPPNYRDKLGARVWWELEYTARKLEQQEQQERQQHRSRRKDTYLSKPEPEKDSVWQTSKLPTTEARRSSRRVQPTGWSKADNICTEKRAKLSEVESGAASDTLETPTISVLLAATRVDTYTRSPIPAPVLRESEGPLDYEASSCSPHQLLDEKRAPSLLEDPDTASEAPSPPVNASNSPSEVEAIGNAMEGFNTLTADQAGGEEGVASVGNRVKQSSAQDSNEPDRGTVKAPLPRKPSFAQDSVNKLRRVENMLQSTITTSDGDSVDDLGEEDEASAQSMWASTRTSYEREPKKPNRSVEVDEKDHLTTTEAVSVVPFTVRGRVPIRIHSSSSKIYGSATFEAQLDNEDDTSSSTTLPTTPSNTTTFEKKARRPVPASTVAPTKYPPPPAAAFIDLESHTTVQTGPSRQDKLTELRQKKLRKLQQARDLSIRQQQTPHKAPSSFSSSTHSKKPSNRQLMQNALEFTLLAGGSMEKERTAALLALAQSSCDNFVVLLKSAKEFQFRALYENHVARDEVVRIFSLVPASSSTAPALLTSNDVVAQFFKYSSAKKQFLPVATRSFTTKTDAFALVDQFVSKTSKKKRSLLLI